MVAPNTQNAKKVVARGKDATGTETYTETQVVFVYFMMFEQCGIQIFPTFSTKRVLIVDVEPDLFSQQNSAGHTRHQS
jgi:hypothetical protein